MLCAAGLGMPWYVLLWLRATGEGVDGVWVKKPLAELLPDSFGPASLGIAERLLPPHSKKLAKEKELHKTVTLFVYVWLWIHAHVHAHART